RRRSAVAAGAVVVLGAGGYVAYAQAGKPANESAYRLGSATKGSGSQTLTLTGTVNRVSQVTATFPVSGTVTGVSVKVGDTVTTGQQLATIDQTPLQAAVTDAEAALLQAQAQLTADESSTWTTTGGMGPSPGSDASGSSGSTGASTSTGFPSRSSNPTGTTSRATDRKSVV